MQRLKISGLPSLVNALIMTSILSAGNGLLYAAARTLHGMSLEGHAPRIFSRCTKQGVPIWALAFSLSFCLLAFLQVKSSSAVVMTYLVDLITCCQMLNYGFTALTYRHFYSALKKQGAVSRETAFLIKESFNLTRHIWPWAERYSCSSRAGTMCSSKAVGI